MAARNRLRIEPGYSFAVLVLAALSPVSRRLPAHGVAPSQFGGPNGALRWLGMRFRPQNASTGRSATLPLCRAQLGRARAASQHAVEASRSYLVQMSSPHPSKKLTTGLITAIATGEIKELASCLASNRADRRGHPRRGSAKELA